MKKNEVPQDNEGLHEGKFRDLCYAVDEDGNYITVHSTGWGPKNEAMKQALGVVEEKMEKAKLQILDGKLSPIAYFKEKHIMDLKLLSAYTGFSKRKVRRHLKPGVFANLDRDTLNKYAEVFEIDPDELLNFTKYYG